MRRPATLLLAAIAWLGCEPDPRVTRLRLEPPDAIGCRPDALTSVRVEALGDLPSDRRPMVLVEVGVDQTIELFPDATEAVAVRAEGFVRIGDRTSPWTGGGVATLAEGELPIPLLRFMRACPLGDPAARTPIGAAAAALPDGGLFVAGGRDAEGDPVQAVVVVRPGRALAAQRSLLVPRAGATATALEDDRVLVAGGTGLATDSLELFDVTEGVEERVENAELLGSRRDHAALRLRAGGGLLVGVLLVGGRDADGALRADAEWIGLDGLDVSTERRPGLVVPRAGHRALALDDGTTLIVGGRDGAGEPVGAVERFDASSGTFEILDDAALPPRLDAAYAAVAGARAAQVGGREGEGWSADVELLLDGGRRRVTLAGVAVVPGTEDDPDPTPIEAPSAVGLRDGRLLVIGRDPRDGLETGRILDPGGTREVEAGAAPLDPSRVATHLVALADGSIAEGDGDGLSLLRVDLATEFSDPSATIFPGQINQLDEVALDAPDGWQPRDGALVAERDGARFDLPTARFRDVSIELEGDGALELLLTPEGAPPEVIAVGPDRLAHGDCAVESQGGATIVVRRVGELLHLDAGGAAAACPSSLPGRVGVAIRASRGSAVRRIAVGRLPRP